MHNLALCVRNLNPPLKALSLGRAPHDAPNRVEPKRQALRLKVSVLSRLRLYLLHAPTPRSVLKLKPNLLLP